LLPPVSPRFVFLRLAIPQEAPGLFRSRRAGCSPTGLELVTRYLRPGRVLVETAASPMFLGNPHLCLCPALRPRRIDRTRPLRCGDAAPILTTRKATAMNFRGSITRLRHSLSTLRRTGHPVTTQDSLPAAGQALPDGLDYPQGSNERFPICFLHLFLLSQALMAQGQARTFSTARLLVLSRFSVLAHIDSDGGHGCKG